MGHRSGLRKAARRMTAAVRNGAHAHALNRRKQGDDQAPVSAGASRETPRKDWRFGGFTGPVFFQVDRMADFQTVPDVPSHATCGRRTTAALRNARADACERSRGNRRNNRRKNRRISGGDFVGLRRGGLGVVGFFRVIERDEKFCLGIGEKPQPFRKERHSLFLLSPSGERAG
jgi:hypothetical protein